MSIFDIGPVDVLDANVLRVGMEGFNGIVWRQSILLVVSFGLLSIPYFTDYKIHLNF
jgi:hypothetical protein